MLELSAIAILWLAYGALHSALASLRAKRWIELHCGAWLPRYRLAYNVLAVILLLPLLAFTARQPGAPLWIWPAWVSWGATIIAATGFIWSLRWYDGATFFGLRQLRAAIGPDDNSEAFHISPLHRHVRHPWYALMLLYLWTRDLNPPWLVAVSTITLYLIVGSRLEERKLIARYGDAYQYYCERVPGLFPRPGRVLTEAEAQALEQLARRDAGAHLV